ncbi:MAG: hypothetical protein QOH34_12, partial [Mycobacterium sp.]|nr:hypothetical protein [Mycobacterium sp.]
MFGRTSASHLCTLEESATDHTRAGESKFDPQPPRTRELLLLMALEGTDDLRVLRIINGPKLTDLDAAERAHLARLDPVTHRLAFRHPLIRATVVELSTADERRRTNRVLAELWPDQPD